MQRYEKESNIKLFDINSNNLIFKISFDFAQTSCLQKFIFKA